MRRIASSLRRFDGPDFAEILAAARRLVERDHMTPHDLFHVGGADPALAASYRQIGFATVEFIAPAAKVPLPDGARVTVVSASSNHGTLRRVAAMLADIQAVILPTLAGKMLATIDRILFDRGLVRLVAPAGENLTLYLRSCLIERVGEIGGRTRASVAMSTLGHNAGFANQLFQYGFLRLYGLRSNCAIETPAWIGESIYALPARPVSRARRGYKGDEWSVRDLALWTAERLPVEVDFWGYFQNPPASWRQHREFLRRLFTPLPPWREPVERWLDKHRPAGSTLVAIHVRRGDYRRYAAEKPWFRLIPEEWYRQWLARIWPTLSNPVLFIATDEREAVLPAFADYAPLVSDEIEAAMPEPRYLADFEILVRADILAIANSSFSRMAALLAPATQRCFIPSPAAEGFEPYDAWAPDDFWRRFGASTTAARRRSVLPRWLRRRAPP
jgi:hypothetical protein